MGLMLAVEASSRTYAVAAGDGDAPAVTRTARRGDPGFAGAGGLADAALAEIGARFGDIETIAVDTGPGGLSSIRSAVAYANGLAFSLGVRVFPVTSLELMAIAAQDASGGKATAADPVLSVKRAQGGNVYAGLYAGGEMTALRHGQPGEVIPELAGNLTTFRLAGLTAADLTDLAGSAPAIGPVIGSVADTGITDADVAVLYATARTGAPERLAEFATALNEGSPVFHTPAFPR